MTTDRIDGTPGVTDGASTEATRGWPDTLESLRAETVAGLLYTHNRVNADSSALLETTALIHAAIELLVERGLLAPERLEERKQRIAERLLGTFLRRGMSVILMESPDDKYCVPGSPPIDCEGRIHLCRAACCRLNFALSEQDVEEGIVRWQLGNPYMNRREADGYCTHLDRASFRCAVHAQRPIPCRVYTCEDDDRIWQDFAGRVPQPDLEARFRDDFGERPSPRAWQSPD